MAHTVFICHSSKDKLVADAACAALEAKRIRCWIAPRDVQAGLEYGADIIDALSHCKIVLLIFSAHSNASPQVRREIERAVSKGKIIVPFRITDVLPEGAMEFALSNTHWLDALSPPMESRLMELCHSVSALLHKRGEPLWVDSTEDGVQPPPPPPPPPPPHEPEPVAVVMKWCPRCRKEFVPTSRHCPFDGSMLSDGPMPPEPQPVAASAQLLIRAKPKISMGAMNALDANSIGVQIDGQTFEMGWGERLFTVQPGTHTLTVGIKSPLYRDMRCSAQLTVQVNPSTTTSLRYTAGLTFFQDGKLLNEGTTESVAPPGRKLCAKCRADMPLTAKFCSHCGMTQV